MRISPRAATGTLDELLPVAALTTPPGEIVGVSCAGNNEAAQRSPTRHLSSVVAEPVRQRSKRPRPVESGSEWTSRSQCRSNVISRSRSGFRPAHASRHNGTYALTPHPGLFFPWKRPFGPMRRVRFRPSGNASYTGGDRVSPPGPFCRRGPLLPTCAGKAH